MSTLNKNLLKEIVVTLQECGKQDLADRVQFNFDSELMWDRDRCRLCDRLACNFSQHKCINETR